MKDPRDYSLELLLITGELVTLEPLHVGSGYDLSDGMTGSFASLCLDLHGKPYLPASSLRGLLCRLLAEPEGAADCHRRLCGSARLGDDPKRTKGDQDKGNAGALRLYDARWIATPVGAPGQASTLERRVAIDPITRTASDHLLFAEEQVPAHTRFSWRIEADRIDAADRDALLAALRRLRHVSGIGAGRSRMQGRLQWDTASERVMQLTRASMRSWLLDQKPLASFFDLHNVELDDPEPTATTGLDPSTGAVHLLLEIEPLAPLLVSPERPRKRPSQRGANEPDLHFRQQDGKVLLPATSLKGMLRAQTRRILMTRLATDALDLNAQQQRELANHLLNRIFGGVVDGHHRIAALHIGAATGHFEPAEQTRQGDQHRQFFNAIDRFTGGVAEGKLYHVQAVLPKSLDWKVTLQPSLLQETWALGLLIYLLRDGIEGDLCIGWGRARGYGAIRIRPRPQTGALPSSWADLLAALDSGSLGFDAHQVAAWQQALETELGRCIAKIRANTEEHAI
jgi:CRISPR/Cas system CSM-associated protein Csm3 (group 7 of RAMP superfamily)